MGSSSVAGGNAGSEEAAPNLRSVGRLLPWTGVRQERRGSAAFDLEVEVEQDGGGEGIMRLLSDGAGEGGLGRACMWVEWNRVSVSLAGCAAGRCGGDVGSGAAAHGVDAAAHQRGH